MANRSLKTDLAYLSRAGYSFYLVWLNDGNTNKRRITIDAFPPYGSPHGRSEHLGELADMGFEFNQDELYRSYSSAES